MSAEIFKSFETKPVYNESQAIDVIIGDLIPT